MCMVGKCCKCMMYGGIMFLFFLNMLVCFMVLIIRFVILFLLFFEFFYFWSFCYVRFMIFVSDFFRFLDRENDGL